MNRYFTLDSADLVVPEQEAWALLADFTTLKEIADTLPGNTSLQNKAISVANEIMNVFDNNDLTSIPRARKLAEEVFGEGWEKKGEHIYHHGPNRAQVWGIGYCHIDTAWLVSHSPHHAAPHSDTPASGYGLTALRSRRWQGHGLLKLISWIVIRSIDSRVAKPNNTSGWNRYGGTQVRHACSK